MEIKLWRYNAHLHISHSLVVVSETGSNPNKLRVGPENNTFSQFQTVIFLWSPFSPDEVPTPAHTAVVPLHRGLILRGEVLPGVGVGGHGSQDPQGFC